MSHAYQYTKDSGVISPCGGSDSVPWGGSGWRKAGHWLLKSYGVCQRGDVNKPRLLHLPLHRKALNSLTCDVWFSLISSHLSMFRSPGFLLQKTPMGPSLSFFVQSTVGRCPFLLFMTAQQRWWPGHFAPCRFWGFFEAHPLWSPPVPASICCHCDWITSSELLKRRSVNCHPINILLGGNLSSYLWECSRSDF